MMHQLIDRKNRLFFYLIIFLFLSTINSFSWIKSKKNLSNVSSIEVEGLSEKLNLSIKKKLEFLLNQNIFFFNKQKLRKELDKYNFLDNYYVYKIFPSKIKINLIQTELLATTMRDNNKYYLGFNGKLINQNEIESKKELPNIFGNFPIDKFISLTKIIQENNFNYESILYFYYFPNGRWDIKMKNDLEIKLPKENVTNSIIIAKKIINSSELGENKVIDLRIPNQVILSNE